MHKQGSHMDEKESQLDSTESHSQESNIQVPTGVVDSQESHIDLKESPIERSRMELKESQVDSKETHMDEKESHSQVSNIMAPTTVVDSTAESQIDRKQRQMGLEEGRMATKQSQEDLKESHIDSKQSRTNLEKSQSNLTEGHGNLTEKNSNSQIAVLPDIVLEAPTDHGSSSSTESREQSDRTSTVTDSDSASRGLLSEPGQERLEALSESEVQKVLEKRALLEESDNEVMEAYRCSIMERLKICNDVAMWFDSVITEKRIDKLLDESKEQGNFVANSHEILHKFSDDAKFLHDASKRLSELGLDLLNVLREMTALDEKRKAKNAKKKEQQMKLDFPVHVYEVEEMNDDADKWEDGTASVSNVLLAAESILPTGSRSNLLKVLKNGRQLFQNVSGLYEEINTRLGDKTRQTTHMAKLEHSTSQLQSTRKLLMAEQDELHKLEESVLRQRSLLASTVEEQTTLAEKIDVAEHQLFALLGIPHPMEQLRNELGEMKETDDILNKEAERMARLVIQLEDEQEWRMQTPLGLQMLVVKKTRIGSERMRSIGSMVMVQVESTGKQPSRQLEVTTVSPEGSIGGLGLDSRSSGKLSASESSRQLESKRPTDSKEQLHEGDEQKPSLESALTMLPFSSSAMPSSPSERDVTALKADQERARGGRSGGSPPIRIVHKRPKAEVFTDVIGSGTKLPETGTAKPKPASPHKSALWKALKVDALSELERCRRVALSAQSSGLIQSKTEPADKSKSTDDAKEETRATEGPCSTDSEEGTETTSSDQSDEWISKEPEGRSKRKYVDKLTRRPLSSKGTKIGTPADSGARKSSKTKLTRSAAELAPRATVDRTTDEDTQSLYEHDTRKQIAKVIRSRVKEHPRTGPRVTPDPDGLDQVTQGPKAGEAMPGEDATVSAVTEPDVTSDPDGHHQVTQDPKAGEATPGEDATVSTVTEPGVTPEDGLHQVMPVFSGEDATISTVTEPDVTPDPDGLHQVTPDSRADGALPGEDAFVLTVTEPDVTPDPDGLHQVTPDSKAGEAMLGEDASVSTATEPDVTQDSVGLQQITQDPRAGEAMLGEDASVSTATEPDVIQDSDRLHQVTQDPRAGEALLGEDASVSTATEPDVTLDVDGLRRVMQDPRVSEASPRDDASVSTVTEPSESPQPEVDSGADHPARPEAEGSDQAAQGQEKSGEGEQDTAPSSPNTSEQPQDGQGTPLEPIPKSDTEIEPRGSAKKLESVLAESQPDAEPPCQIDDGTSREQVAALTKGVETAVRRFRDTRNVIVAVLQKQYLTEHVAMIAMIKGIVDCDIEMSEQVEDNLGNLRKNVRGNLLDFQVVFANAVKLLRQRKMSPTERPAPETSSAAREAVPSGLDAWTETTDKVKSKEMEYAGLLSRYQILWFMYNKVKADLLELPPSKAASGPALLVSQDAGAGKEQPTIADAMPQTMTLTAEKQPVPDNKTKLPKEWKQELNAAKEAVDAGAIPLEDYMEQVSICLRMASLLQHKSDMLGKTYPELRLKQVLAQRIQSILKEVGVKKQKLKQWQAKSGITDYDTMLAGLDKMEKAIRIEQEQTVILVAMRQAYIKMRTKMIRQMRLCAMDVIYEDEGQDGESPQQVLFVVGGEEDAAKQGEEDKAERAGGKEGGKTEMESVRPREEDEDFLSAAQPRSGGESEKSASSSNIGQELLATTVDEAKDSLLAAKELAEEGALPSDSFQKLRQRLQSMSADLPRKRSQDAEAMSSSLADSLHTSDRRGLSSSSSWHSPILDFTDLPATSVMSRSSLVSCNVVPSLASITELTKVPSKADSDDEDDDDDRRAKSALHAPQLPALDLIPFSRSLLYRTHQTQQNVPVVALSSPLDAHRLAIRPTAPALRRGSVVHVEEWGTSALPLITGTEIFPGSARSTILDSGGAKAPGIGPTATPVPAVGEGLEMLALQAPSALEGPSVKPPADSDAAAARSGSASLTGVHGEALVLLSPGSSLPGDADALSGPSPAAIPGLHVQRVGSRGSDVSAPPEAEPGHAEVLPALPLDTLVATSPVERGRGEGTPLVPSPQGTPVTSPVGPRRLTTLPPIHSPGDGSSTDRSSTSSGLVRGPWRPRMDEFEGDSPAGRPLHVHVPRRLRPLDSCDLKEYLQTLPPPTRPSLVERQERPHIHDKLALLQRMQGTELREGAESPLSSPRKGKEVVSNVVDWLLSSGVHPAPPVASGPPASPDAMARRRQQTKSVRRVIRKRRKIEQRLVEEEEDEEGMDQLSENRDVQDRKLGTPSIVGCSGWPTPDSDTFPLLESRLFCLDVDQTRRKAGRVLRLVTDHKLEDVTTAPNSQHIWNKFLRPTGRF